MEFKDKLLIAFTIITYVVISMLYQFRVIACHYIFGLISYFIMFVLFFMSLSKKIKIPYKRLIVLVSEVLTIIMVVITHLTVSNNPIKYHYEETDNGIKITGYTYKIRNSYYNDKCQIKIPSHINGLEVKIIGEGAFTKATTYFTEDFLPDTVEIIEKEAFRGKKFYGQVLRFHEGLQYIGEYAFYDININYVVIPSTIEFVGKEAFRYHEISFVIDTNSYIDKWDKEWNGYNSGIPAPKISYDSKDFYISEKNIYVLHNDYTSTLVDMNYDSNKILDKIIYNNEEYVVTTIGNAACYNLKYEEIILPNTITKIESRAFGLNEELKYIYIPNSVIYVEEEILIYSPKVIIYTGYSEIPSTWHQNWNTHNKVVNLNATPKEME